MADKSFDQMNSIERLKASTFASNDRNIAMQQAKEVEAEGKNKKETAMINTMANNVPLVGDPTRQSASGKRQVQWARQQQALLQSGNPMDVHFAVGRGLGLGDQEAMSFAAQRAQDEIAQVENGRWEGLYVKAPNVANILRRDENVMGAKARGLTESMRLAVLNDDVEAIKVIDGQLSSLREANGLKATKAYYYNLSNQLDEKTYNERNAKAEGVLGEFGAFLDTVTFGEERRKSAEGWLAGGLSNEERLQGGQQLTVTQAFGDADLVANSKKGFVDQVAEGAKGFADLATGGILKPGAGKNLVAGLIGDQYAASALVGGAAGGLAFAKAGNRIGTIGRMMKAAEVSKSAALLKAGYLGVGEALGSNIAYSANVASNAQYTTDNTFTSAYKAAAAQSFVAEFALGMAGAGFSFLGDVSKMKAKASATPDAGTSTTAPNATTTPSEATPETTPSVTPDNEVIYFRDMPEIKGKIAQPKEIPVDASPEEKMVLMLENAGFSRKHGKLAVKLASAKVSPTSIEAFARVNESASRNAWEGLGTERDIYAMSPLESLQAYRADFEQQGIPPQVIDRMIYEQKVMDTGSRSGSIRPDTVLLKSEFETKFGERSQTNFSMYVLKEQMNAERLRAIADVSYSADIWAKAHSYSYSSPITEATQRPFNLSSLPRPKENFLDSARKRALRDAGLSDEAINKITRTTSEMPSVPEVFEPVIAVHDNALRIKKTKGKDLDEVFTSMNESYSKALELAKRIQTEGDSSLNGSVKAEKMTQLRKELDETVADYVSDAEIYFRGDSDIEGLIDSDAIASEVSSFDLSDSAIVEHLDLDSAIDPTGLTDAIGVHPESLVHHSAIELANNVPEARQAGTLAVQTLETEAGPGASAGPALELLDEATRQADQRLGETGNTIDAAAAVSDGVYRPTPKTLIEQTQWFDSLSDRIGSRDTVTVQMGSKQLDLQKTEQGILVALEGEQTLIRPDGTYTTADGKTFGVGQDIARLIQRVPFDSSSIQKVLGVNDETARAIGIGELENASAMLNDAVGEFYSILDNPGSTPELKLKAYQGLIKNIVDVSNHLGIRSGSHASTNLVATTKSSAEHVKGVWDSLNELSQSIKTGAPIERIQESIVRLSTSATRAFEEGFASADAKARAKINSALGGIIKLSESLSSRDADGIKKLDKQIAKIGREIEEFTGMSLRSAGSADRFQQVSRAVMTERAMGGNLAIVHPVSFMMALMQHSKIPVFHSVGGMAKALKDSFVRYNSQGTPIVLPNVTNLGSVQYVRNFFRGESIPNWAKPALRGVSKEDLSSGIVQVGFRVENSQLIQEGATFTTGYGQVIYTVNDLARASVDRNFKPRPIWDLSGTTLAPNNKTIDNSKSVSTTFTQDQYRGISGALTSRSGNIPVLSIYEALKAQPFVEATVPYKVGKGNIVEVEGRFELVKTGDEYAIAFKHDIPTEYKEGKTGPNLTATYILEPRNFDGTPSFVGASINIRNAELAQNIKPTQEQLASVEIDRQQVARQPYVAAPKVEGSAPMGARTRIGEETHVDGVQEFVTQTILDAVSDSDYSPSVMLYGVNAMGTNPNAGKVYARAGALNATFTTTEVSTFQGKDGQAGVAMAYDGNANIAVVNYGGGKGKVFTSTYTALEADMKAGNTPGLVVVTDSRAKGKPELITKTKELLVANGYKFAGSDDYGKTLVYTLADVPESLAPQSKEALGATISGIVKSFEARKEPSLTAQAREIPTVSSTYTMPGNVFTSAPEGGMTPQALDGILGQIKPGEGEYIGVINNAFTFEQATPMTPAGIQDLANALKSPDVDQATEIFIGGNKIAIGAIPDQIMQMLPPANGAATIDLNSVRIDLSVNNRGSIKGLSPMMVSKKNYTPSKVFGNSKQLRFGPDADAIKAQIPQKASKLHLIKVETQGANVWETRKFDLGSVKYAISNEYADPSFRRGVKSESDPVGTAIESRLHGAASGNLMRGVIDAQANGGSTDLSLAVFQNFLQMASDLPVAKVKELAQKVTNAGVPMTELSPMVKQVFEKLQDPEVVINGKPLDIEQILDQVGIKVEQLEPSEMLPKRLQLKGEDKVAFDFVNQKINESLESFDASLRPKYDPRMAEAIIAEVIKQSKNPKGTKKGFGTKEIAIGVMGSAALLSAMPFVVDAEADEDETIFDFAVPGVSVAYLAAAGLGAVVGGRFLRKYKIGDKIKPIIQKHGKGNNLVSVMGQFSYKTFIKTKVPMVADAMTQASAAASQDIRHFQDKVLVNIQRHGITESEAEIALTAYSKELGDIMRLTGVIDPLQRIQMAVGNQYKMLESIANGTEQPSILSGMITKRGQAGWILDTMDFLASKKINYEAMPGALFANDGAVNLAVTGGGFDSAKFVEMFHKSGPMGSKLAINDEGMRQLLKQAYAENPHIDVIDHASNLLLAYVRSGGPQAETIQSTLFNIAEAEFEKINLKKPDPKHVIEAKKTATARLTGNQFSSKAHVFAPDYSFLPRKTINIDPFYRVDPNGSPIEVNSLGSFVKQYEALAKVNHAQSSLAHLEDDLKILHAEIGDNTEFLNLIEMDTGINMAASFDPEYKDKGDAMGNLMNNAVLGNIDAFAYTTILKTDPSRAIKEPLQTMAGIIGRSGLTSAVVGTAKFFKDVMPFTESMSPDEVSLVRSLTSKMTQTHMFGLNDQIELSWGQRYQARSERPLLENYGGVNKFLKAALPKLTWNPGPHARMLLRLPDNGQPIHFADVPQGHTLAGQIYNGIVTACADIALHAADFDFHQTVKRFVNDKAGEMDMQKLGSTFSQADLSKIKSGNYSPDEFQSYKERFMDLGIRATIGAKGMSVDTQITSTQRTLRWTETFTRAVGQIVNASLHTTLIPAMNGDARAIRNLAAMTGFGAVGATMLMEWLGLNESRRTKIAEESNAMARWFGYMQMNIAAGTYAKLASGIGYAVFSDQSLSSLNDMGADQLGFTVNTIKDAGVAIGKAGTNASLAPLEDFAIDRFAGVRSTRMMIENGLVDGMATPYSKVRAHYTSRGEEMSRYLQGNMQRLQEGSIKPLNVVPTWLFHDPIVAAERRKQAKEVLAKYNKEFAQAQANKQFLNQMQKEANQKGMGDLKYKAGFDARSIGTAQNIEVMNRLGE